MPNACLQHETDTGHTIRQTTFCQALQCSAAGVEERMYVDKHSEIMHLLQRNCERIVL